MSQMPEGAVYDLLHCRGVPGVPKVYDSGIIISDLREFRLEYLIIEDCGQRITDYVDNHRERDTSQIARGLTAQVCECLVSAYSNGILHRDISPGNIAVCNGVAKVIDWGYALIFDLESSESKEIANRWNFDPFVVIKEDDPFVGTDLYMSINLLSRSKKRGLLDDIESLFYVMLDAYSTRRTSSDKQIPYCFQFYNPKNFAASRAAILSLDTWLSDFGVETNSSDLRRLFDKMHTFLFKQGNNFIGLRLMRNDGFERAIDIKVAKEFMNKKTRKILRNLPRFAADDILPSTVTDVTMEVSNTPRKSRKNKADISGNSKKRLSKKTKH
ncbi:hypothetical protein LPJ73_000759 [Coemansia sp. RSA 2703]|nr:hypothetical protein LPJ73_000759 [Coemansia sp. RSA 2703]